jgi:hypothetical protein
MVSDFNNRIEAQRDILRVVNSRTWPIEQLYALSDGAIQRWIMINHIDAKSEIASLVVNAGDALNFLANQSQEQVSGEYQMRSKEFSLVLEKVKLEIAQH